jgi:hypothetical protein
MRGDFMIKNYIKELEDKLFAIRYILIVFAVLSIVGAALILGMSVFELWIRIVVAVFLALLAFYTILCVIKIEQSVGTYICTNCEEASVPSFKTILFVPHFGMTRYMKCPHCGFKKWRYKSKS